MDRLVQQRLFTPESDFVGLGPAAAPPELVASTRLFSWRRRTSRKMLRAAIRLCRTLFSIAAGEETEISAAAPSEAPLGFTPKGRPRKRRKKSLFYIVPDVPCDDVPQEFEQSSQVMIYERAEMLRRGELETKDGAKIPAWSPQRLRKRNCYQTHGVIVPTFDETAHADRQRREE